MKLIHFAYHFMILFQIRLNIFHENSKCLINNIFIFNQCTKYRGGGLMFLDDFDCNQERNPQFTPILSSNP